MGLQRELPSAGNWLFRWRSFLPIVVVAGGMFAMFPLPYPKHDGEIPELLETIAIGISFLGMLIRILTIGHTPVGTSGRNTTEQIAVTLNTTGIYSTVRHPLYLGNFFIGLGLSMFTLVWWFIIIYVLTFWLYYERIMLAEESFLRGKFGGDFDDWVRRTPAFLPMVKNYIRPLLPFSFRNVMRREYNTLLQIVLVAFLLECAGDWFDSERCSVSALRCLFFGSSVLLWGILRTLKRHTTVLNCDGR
jgi:protein-S-isoprenylcysteine O-methyltransferase Ste14